MATASHFPKARAKRALLDRDFLASYCRDMIEQRRQVRKSPEAEKVHDLRVAAHRLGAVIRFMEPKLPAKRARAVRRRSRRIRRVLGTLRNADVTADLVARLSRSLPPAEKAAIHPLLVRLRSEAAVLRRGASRSGKFPVLGIRKRIERLLASAPRRGQRSLDSRVDAILFERISKFERNLRKSANGDAQSMHRVRIAVKRYRYTLELLERAGRPQPENALREAKQLQKVLGRLHDLDVLLGLLRKSKSGTPAHALASRLRQERRRRLEAARSCLKQFLPVSIPSPTRPRSRRFS
ncbi:MAG TPA: CHAD domain-containing protein [Candidatus Polarisedimenticolia bacterium]|jgi:CHAD domain-containing protein|nr:CHAD domain-containing protein [Candidatus Polarisedimenticolia bacterium]